MQTFSLVPRAVACGLLSIATLLGGCATASAPAVIESVPDEAAISARVQLEPEFIPVARYGRYTLVELAPLTAQRDLLQQVIDVRMPEEARASIGDGLRHVLKRSGYQMCETAHAVIQLYSLPMPAAHLQLGPMTLRDALLTLIGPVWDLEVDDRSRQVCFVQPRAQGALPIQELPPTGAIPPIQVEEGSQP
ncbi:TPA: integrating conjugative element protein pill, pfgi-1 [Citrobacter farmeri]|jgi:conjugative transfer region protein (TIGR03748 family)|uniref:Integrating conjugative element protein pill, pfgi-1 n=2 Tax=Enterobacteriaceae TaxID=543 RepID=A0A8H9TV78_9ENTR|nr:MULTISPECIES: PilL N-terminal domain-containing protein [Pseudomonadota]EKD2602341.1 PilL N-terminal domain-containing protein [Escherichia coli]NRF59857.1 integrating conjugative element protein pill, pfgi-1 [Citrobacter braakii]WPE26239.1 hypothetical protein PshuTeo1_19560 [Pseudomonas hunanensis]HAT3749083.1 integrating conjugative element protein pill, pfgi-1 [Klebsiella oxytoca]HED3645974.1 PilL N-terminal domain-containing protein [Klebsiella pneumoniae]